MTNVDFDSLWVRLRRRKVVQWGIAYAAGAWGLLQGLEYVTQTFGWAPLIQQLTTLALLVGLPVVLVIAWYHGDQGKQRVTGPELAIITLLFLIAGAMFWRYDRGAGPANGATPPAAAAAPAAPVASSAGAPPNSIAVLPFVNMSQDTANEYFSDGISEEILNSLAQIPALQVAARTSSFSFKGQNREVPAIARDLKVRMVLEGSVRKQDDRVRITAQLIDAQSGFHVWSQTYDRELKDIFAIQDEIARAIADALKVKLGAAHAAASERPESVDPLAYDLYLRGLALWQARGQENLDEAEAYFHKAIERDPAFAKAWAGVALVETIRPDWFGTPESVTGPLARDAAERALALDPMLPEAYAALGNTAFYDGRWQTGRALFERALAIAPSYATGWQWYAFGVSLVDASGEAVDIAAKAVELDPRAPVVRHDMAVTLYRAGRFQEAEAQDRQVVDDPGVRTSALLTIHAIQLVRRDFEGARATLRQLAEPRGAASVAFVNRLVDALEGKVETAPVAQELMSLPDGYLDSRSISPLGEADVIAWLAVAGRRDDALRRLEKISAASLYLTRTMIADPLLDPIRCRPEFRAIVEKAGSGDPHYARVCGKATRT